jgi:two-component system, response regulator / RNA-binding antiterminator
VPTNLAKLSVLIVTDPGADSATAHDMEEALANAGHLVLGVRAGDARLPDAVAHLNPDVIVVRSDAAVRDVLEHIVLATRDARRPIALFTQAEDRDHMRAAFSAGVSAYMVAGLKPERVQAVVDVALERFAADEALRTELAATKQQLSERKTIDRAKALLMDKRGMREREAHRFLQHAAMQKGLKLHEVAERLLDVESLLG